VTDPLIDLRAASRRFVAPLYLASLPIGVAFFGATTATTGILPGATHGLRQAGQAGPSG
jgi:hypothetical protein